MSFSSDTLHLHLVGSCLSGNPSSSCIFPPIHSARLVGRNCSTRRSLQYVYLSHTLSCTSERSIGSVATGETLYGLGSSRSRLTALDQPLRSAIGETDDEISIGLVYVWYKQYIYSPRLGHTAPPCDSDTLTHYVVGRMSNNCLASNIENAIVQQCALLLISVSTLSGL